MKRYRLSAILIITLLLLTLIPFSPPASPVLADVTSVTITSPTTASPAYAKTGGKVNVVFTVTCNAANTADIEIEVLSDSTPVASLHVETSLASGDNNLNYDVTLSGVAAGTYDVRVRARQPAGSGTWTDWTVQQDAVIVENTPPTVTLYQPTTGACLKGGGGSTFDIVWVATDTSGQNLDYKLEYFNGSAWQNITTLTNQPQGQRTYTWTVPALNIANAQVRVTATDKAGNSATATSGAFTIDSTAPTVTQITKPTAGEKLTAGSTYQLQWVASDTLPGNLTYKLEYTCNGADWNTIQSSLSGPQGTNTYNWTVPPCHSANCQVRITPKDCAGNTGAELTSATFTIEDKTAPTCKVNSPNGGEVWSAGTTRDIEWTCTDNAPGNVTIEMFYCHNYTSPDSCNIPVNLGSYSQGAGSYNWNVPTPPSGQTSDQCRVCIKCTDAAGNSSSDCSDNNFTIVKHNQPPTVQLLSPNGGETWQGGTCQVIRWTATDPADPRVALDFTLKYSTDGGATYPNTIVTLKNREQGEHTFCWAVPNVPDTDYRVLVEATGPGGSASDASDSNFTVTAATAPDPITKTINLKTGWNLISLQLMPTCCPSNNTACAACACPIESILADCLDNIKSVWYWTGGDSGAWLSYAPGAPSSLTTMTDGKAYWIYATADCSFTYQGRKGPPGGGFPTTPYSYVPGWNMVGFKSTTAKPVQEYLGGTCGGTSPTYLTPVYGWNPNAQTWTNRGCTDDMTPGRGYWVYFNTAHTVNAGAD